MTVDLGAEVPAGGKEGLDPQLHHLDGDAEDVARYVLTLDATNFGSGWFDELAVDTDVLTARLTAHWSRTARLAADDVARVFELPAGHELTRLYVRAVEELDAWLDGTTAMARIAEAGGSASRFAQSLIDGMPLYADPGFAKRAQITANDLVHAGVAAFTDVDRLTVFADNLLPHVLRVDGVLRYGPELAARVDGGVELVHGSVMEVELRACTVVACEAIAARLGVAPRTLDNWLWNRGREARYRRGRPHVTRTTAY